MALRPRIARKGDQEGALVLRSPSSRRFLPLGLAALLAFVSIAGIALAKTFDPSNKRIVLHESIAGVKVGQSPGAAKAAWGGARCIKKGESLACRWRGSSERKGSLSFIYATGTDRVSQVSTNAGISAPPPRSVYPKPLSTVKTSKGIGLGSKRSALKKAHPGGKSVDGPSIDYCLKRGNTTTVFQFGERLRVNAITIYRGYGDQLATCD